MASSIFQRTVVDEQGNIVTGAVVEVRNELTDELAPIFVDRPLTEVKANPFTTDSTGFIKFFVRRGEYRIKATFGDNEIVWRFVQMLDTDYLVNLDVEQTLENKTLIEPNIEKISNAGLLTLPAATDTLVGRATTDTLTNKTLTSPTINGGTITGITDLAVADGGTGRSTLTANNVLIGNGTSAVNFVAPGAADNVLKSNGTQWVSGPFTATGAGNFTTLNYTEILTGGTGIVNLGSGQFVKLANGNIGLGTTTPLSYGAFGLEISNTDPVIRLNHSNGQADLKNYELRAVGIQGPDGLRIRHVNDANTIFTDLMVVKASGNLQFNSGFGSVQTAYGCRAWVNFDGTGTVAIRGSGNISSITDNAQGNYTINFSTAMPDTNYSFVYTCNWEDSFAIGLASAPVSMVKSTTQLTIHTSDPRQGNKRDFTQVNAVIFR